MTPPKTVLVCGPRDCTIDSWIWTRLSQEFKTYLPKLVIQSGAPGVDLCAKKWAESWEIPVRTFEADWGEYGKAAGPRRNQRMLDEGRPDLVIAFVYPSRETRGMADMIRRTKKAGVRLLVIKIVE